MTDVYPPLSVPATPDYFLALFRRDPDQYDLSGGLVTRLLPPRRVALGGLVTFRDLARAVAVQQPA